MTSERNIYDFSKDSIFRLKTELKKLESRMNELTAEVARLKSTADMLHSFEKAHDITQAISMQLNKLVHFIYLKKLQR